MTARCGHSGTAPRRSMPARQAHPAVGVNGNRVAAYSSRRPPHPPHPMHPLRADRRHLLRLAAAAAGTLWLPRSAWSQPRLTDNPFALGVASGSPLPGSVVLWTRLVSPGLFGGSNLPDSADHRALGGRARRGLCACRAEGPGPGAARTGATACMWKPRGWTAGRCYFYRFMAGGDANQWVSAIGRTSTLPAPDATARGLRLAYASCQRWEHGYFSAWRHVRGRRPGRGGLPRRLHLRIPRRRATPCAPAPVPGR